MLASAPWTFATPDETRSRGLLARICAQPDLHARFLNTLSLLEHIGSRKIMASQSHPSSLDQETLKHLAEETRHAFFFKRAAEAAAGAPMAYSADEILAGAQARLYMGRLDAFIARTAQGPAAYLYMSLIVELRAIWLYKVYQDVLRQTGHTLKLASILAEEERHLETMQSRLQTLDEGMDARMPLFIAFERARFTAVLDALEACVAAPSHARAG